jgi:hypothetical protein
MLHERAVKDTTRRVPRRLSALFVGHVSCCNARGVAVVLGEGYSHELWTKQLEPFSKHHRELAGRAIIIQFFKLYPQKVRSITFADAATSGADH